MTDHLDFIQSLMTDESEWLITRTRGEPTTYSVYKFFGKGPREIGQGATVKAAFEDLERKLNTPQEEPHGAQTR